jgi:hypothetical protein
MASSGSSQTRLKSTWDLIILVAELAEDIANGEKFVDRRGDAVLACVFHSLPAVELSAGLLCLLKEGCMRGD